MPGFSSYDQVIDAITSGQTFKSCWGKNFNPTTAAVANEWHTLFRGGGNPPADAIFNAGTMNTFQPVKDTTTNAGSMAHGGNVQPDHYKYLLAGSAVSAAATVVAGTLALVDVIGFYRITNITNTAGHVMTASLGQTDTFSASVADSTIEYTSTANIPSNLLTGTRVRCTTATTLPGGLSPNTDYYVIRVSDTACRLSTSYTGSIGGSYVTLSTVGTGTHTLNWMYPRYTNGAGVQAIMFNSNATALGAATPNLSMVYTSSAAGVNRSTPLVLPIGKTAGSNSLILYTGATGVGKYNYAMPLQSGDAGISYIDTVTNSTNYVSGEYTVALIKEIGRWPLSTLGLAAERNFMTEMPSLPRIYDGASLYFMWGSGQNTPANSAFSGHCDFIWR